MLTWLILLNDGDTNSGSQVSCPQRKLNSNHHQIRLKDEAVLTRNLEEGTGNGPTDSTKSRTFVL